MIALLGSLKPKLAPEPPPVSAYNLDYLVIAGGGAGGAYTPEGSSSGGGGAGGYRSGTLLSQTVARYFITIGAGGAAPLEETLAQIGFNSSLISTAQNITSTGGGAGNPKDGGSGAGSMSLNAYGLGIAGQGNNGAPGGNVVPTSPVYVYFGGGGGAGQAGQLATTTAKGGDGLTWVDGITRAGGGGGLKYGSPSQLSYSGPGGAGGGGNGLYLQDGVGQPYIFIPATPGTQNTGGGGGGGYFSADPSTTGASGGSGFVKVRYLGTPRGTGGAITQSGGYTYHTFTSSGTLIFTS
jgi:hypothetical protein